MSKSKIKAKKIKFNFDNDISHCVHDVISVWLHELDEESDEKIQNLLKQKIMELEQVINRSGKPNIHFKNVEALPCSSGIEKLLLNKQMKLIKDIQPNTCTSATIAAMQCYMKCAVRWVLEALLAGSLAFASGLRAVAAKDNVPAKCVGLNLK